jgi:hypothetical protein
MRNYIMSASIQIVLIVWNKHSYEWQMKQLPLFGNPVLNRKPALLQLSEGNIY